MTEVPNDTDQLRWAHELKIRGAERAHDDANEFFARANDAAVKSSELALRTAILINGGAAVAILAFVGGIASKNGDSLGGPIQAVASSLIWFACGIVSGALATGCAYATNYCIAGKVASQTQQWTYPYVADGPNTSLWMRFIYAFQFFAVGLSILSLLFFVCGIVDVKYGVAQFK